MKKVYLFEDHDWALKIWKKHRVKDLDLVHVDAHIDFGFHQAESVDTVLSQVHSVEELKRKLEYSIAFTHFENDFSKQIDIGNYIYPAMRDGIVRDFYWVIPGGRKEFRASKKLLIATLRPIAQREGSKNLITFPAADMIVCRAMGRRICICTLESLPPQEQEVLLDIDTDFLVIDSVKNANNTFNVGARKPWIKPTELVGMLKKKIRAPKIITIAYSASGGYTPMKYRHLGDELAFLFAFRKFKRQYERNRKSAEFFDEFLARGKKKHYDFAVRLNPVYRAADNNYGPLYLVLKKYRAAQEEFCKIEKVDRKNPAVLTGLGLVALEKKHFNQAKKYFSSVLNSAHQRLFLEQKKQSLLGKAEAEYRLKNLGPAKKLLISYIKQQPLEPGSRYLLGRIYEKEQDFPAAARGYQDALRLGHNSLEALYRLAKISVCLKEKKSIIKYITGQLKRFKKIAFGDNSKRFSVVRKVLYTFLYHKKQKQRRFSKKEKKQLFFIENIVR